MKTKGFILFILIFLLSFPIALAQENNEFNISTLDELDSLVSLCPFMEKEFFPVRKFHIAMFQGWQITGLYNDIEEAILVQTQKEDGDDGPGMDLDLSASYSVFNNYRIRFTYQRKRSKTIEAINWDQSSSEKVLRTSYSLDLDYVILPINRFLLSRSELTIGGGIALYNLKLNYGYSDEDYNYPERIIYNKLGAHLRASYDYYFTSKVSMNLNFDGRILPNILVPATPRVQEHKINYSSLDITFGLHLHF